MILLCIIFGLLAAAAAVLFWRERKSRQLYERSYRSVAKDYSELRHSHGVIIREGGSYDSYQRRQALKIAAALVILGTALAVALRRGKSKNEN